HAWQYTWEKLPLGFSETVKASLDGRLSDDSGIPIRACTARKGPPTPTVFAAPWNTELEAYTISHLREGDDTNAPTGTILREVFKYSALRFGPPVFVVYWKADGTSSVTGMA
ncbi:MAG: hypothetical protein SGCHY_004579, partial [Lobulomycetales sp.]